MSRSFFIGGETLKVEDSQKFCLYFWIITEYIEYIIRGQTVLIWPHSFISCLMHHRAYCPLILLFFQTNANAPHRHTHTGLNSELFLANPHYLWWPITYFQNCSRVRKKHYLLPVIFLCESDTVVGIPTKKMIEPGMSFCQTNKSPPHQIKKIFEELHYYSNRRGPLHLRGYADLS